MKHCLNSIMILCNLLFIKTHEVALKRISDDNAIWTGSTNTILIPLLGFYILGRISNQPPLYRAGCEREQVYII